MISNRMKLAISVAAIVGMQVFSVAAQAETLGGKLVELSSVDSTVTVQLEGAPPEKLFTTYKVANDARWHICLKDTCIIKKGCRRLQDRQRVCRVWALTGYRTRLTM